MMKATKNCLSQVNIFKSLTEDALTEMANYVRLEKYSAGDIVYQNGQKASEFYIIHSGRIRTFRLSENGKLQTLRYVKTGEFAGDLAYFRDLENYEANADAIVDSVIGIITYSDLDNLIEKYPQIQKDMLNALATRLSDLENLTLSITTQTASERLIHYLVSKSVVTKDGKRLTKSNLSRKDAASYLGITPETMSRLITNLEKSGQIAIHKEHFEIL